MYVYLYFVFVYLCICVSVYLYLYICTCVFMMVLAGWRAAEEVGLILSPIFTHDRDGLCYLYQPIFTNLRLNRSSALYFLDALAATHSCSLWVAHSMRNVQVYTFVFLYFQFMFCVCGQLCAEVHIQQWAECSMICPSNGMGALKYSTLLVTAAFIHFLPYLLFINASIAMIEGLLLESSGYILCLCVNL